MPVIDSLMKTVDQNKVKITPSDGSITEPTPTPEKAEYGKIQVKENKGGFLEIYDETEGNVRKISQHPTGTYDAMLDDGNRVFKTTNKQIHIVDGSWEISIGGDVIELVNKGVKIEIKEDFIENIQGNVNSNVEKEKATKVGSNVINDYGADFSEKISGNSEVTIGGNHKESIGGNVNESVGGNHKESVSGNLNITVSGNATISAPKITLSASSVVAITAPAIKLG